MSITWKLTAVTLVTVQVVLVLGVWLLVRREIRTLRRDTAHSLSLAGRLVADYSVPDLAFEDRQESERTLARLAQSETIEVAALYDASDQLFSTWRRLGVGHSHRVPDDLGSTCPRDGVRVVGSHVEMCRRVTHEGRAYGRLRLIASTERLKEAIWSSIRTAAAVGLGLLALSLVFALSLQRVVSRPIIELSRVAEQVSETADYSLRAKPVGRDEIGVLSADFNSMLAAMERRQRERDAAAAAQARYATRLKLLHGIDRSILAGRSRGDTAQWALEGLEKLFRGARARVVELSPDLRVGRVIAAIPQTADAPERREPLLQGPDAELPRPLLQGEPYVVEDARQDSPPSPLLAAEAEAGSLTVLPLFTHDELVGCLTLSAERAGPLDPEAMEVAQEVAERLAVAISEARLAFQVARNTEELEERVARRTGELEESYRQLEAFAYSVAHDLRAPLRAMQGFATALADDYEGALDATGQDYAERIVEAGERLQLLIDDLLEYGRLTTEALDLGPVDLDAVVDEVLSQQDAALRESGAEVTVERPLGRVVGHASTLVQVAGNLVSNALKFVSPDVVPEVRIHSEEHDGTVRLRVDDNGIGIAPEHAERVFEVFERLHSRADFPGTGIGLAIVRKGVERMGGSVGVESEPGTGSRFRVDLPRAGC